MGTLRLVPGSGPAIDFVKDQSLVGRDPSCELVVTDGSVSRRHARIERHGTAWWVVDQGRANGTYVKSLKVSEKELKNGQELRFGALAFSIDLQEDPEATVATPFLADDSATLMAERGMTFATLPPTMFLVAHVDYVRTVRVLPLGPEETELTVDWYVHRDVVDHPALNVEQLIAFASQVVSEDARACELNQAGMRSGRHRRGVLLEVENYVFDFEQWVRGRVEHGGR